MNTTATTAPVTLSNDLLTGMEWSPAQVRSFLHLAADVKAHPDRYRGALAGRFFALIFEKPSLRTRVTFEVGIASLGGSSVFLDHTSPIWANANPSRRGEKPGTLGARVLSRACSSRNRWTNWPRTPEFR
jgi:ornithine carbamoyltransferase